jgi:hypothetical protein
MPRRVLLDTGVIVALVNAADPDHARCVDVWRGLRAQLVTVEGVLVEAAHLLRRARGGPEAAIGLVLAAGVRLLPPTEPRLVRALALMQTYRDIPMDLVDALLVVSAEELGIVEVLSLDRRGFNAYRAGGRRGFKVLPG